MAWGSKTSATQITGINSTTVQYFNQNITLNPGEIAHVQVTSTYGGTTDDMVYYVESTLDDSSENWDTTAYMSFTMSSGSVAAVDDRSFLVSGVYKARVGVASSGTTDSHTADMSFRKDGVSA